MSRAWIGAGAAIVAAGAVGAVIWQTRVNLGPARSEIRSARAASQGSAPIAGGEPGSGAEDERISAPGTAGGRLERSIEGAPPFDLGPSAAGREFTFASYASPSAAADALVHAESEVRARADDLLSAVAVPAVQRLGLVRSWIAMLDPIIRGDEEAFVQAAAQLGSIAATTASDDPVRSLFQRVQSLLGGASLDPVSTEFTVLDEATMTRLPRLPNMPGMSDRPGAPMMMAVIADEGPDGVRRERKSVLVPLTALFPDAGRMADEGGRVAEVFTACRLPEEQGADADAGLAAYFVYNGAEAAWQPVGLRIELVSDAANDRFSAMAKAARERAAQNGGGR